MNDLVHRMAVWLRAGEFDDATRVDLLKEYDAQYAAPPEEERVPVQGEYRGGRTTTPPGTVTKAEHEEAWRLYAARYGTSQSAARIAERGGFCYSELVLFLGSTPKTWKPR